MFSSKLVLKTLVERRNESFFLPIKVSTLPPDIPEVPNLF